MNTVYHNNLDCRGLCYGFNNAPMDEVFHNTTLTEIMKEVYNISGTGVENNRQDSYQSIAG